MLLEKIPPGPDTIRILLTTDNHVGFAENDPIRGDDAWKTFNEITKIARERDVDMLVQGGDLFHINKPTKKSMFQVMKSLRLNCMGDRPCELELMSDPSLSLTNGFNTVNYEDPNLNISIPVFAISGNHDDATGDMLLLPLDVLSISGLINHFGKVADNENITISPLLFQKGTSKLALYGMANVRDERLHRAFRDGLVKFQRPNIHTDLWFNLFCIHQNHAQHTFTSSIPENFLPNFLDFILWGHEHECIPFPVPNPDMGFDVLQGGSLVATSLSEGEIPDKYAFILSIKGRDYSIEPIKLKSVRPFVMKELILQETDLVPGEASKADVIAFLNDEVERAIVQANEKYKENNPELFEDGSLTKIPLPLIRLKVEYSGGYEIENIRRFSNRFVGKIANVNDVIKFYKKRSRDTDISVKKTKFQDKDLVQEGKTNKKSTELQLTDYMTEFLSQADLMLLPEAGLSNAVLKYIENEDKHILDQYIRKEIKRESEMLMKINIDDTEFHNDETQAKNVFRQVLNQVKRETKNKPKSHVYVESDDDIEIPEEVPKKKRAPARKKKTEAIVVDSDDDEDFEAPTKSKPKRGSRRSLKDAVVNL